MGLKVRVRQVEIRVNSALKAPLGRLFPDLKYTMRRGYWNGSGEGEGSPGRYRFVAAGLERISAERERIPVQQRMVA
jgi:hypothetical protein